MIAFLIALRDAIIAMALAWVGVTMESSRNAETCAADACRTQTDR